MAFSRPEVAKPNGPTVLAFSSSANLGPGFDVLAVAHDAYYDVADVIHVEEKGCGRVNVVFSGSYARDVDPDNNTVVEAIRELLRIYKLDVDLVVRVRKEIPVSAGLGGSAASAVAALVAVCNALGLDVNPLEIARICGYAERVSAGSPHFDNAAASAYGHMVLILSVDPLVVRRVELNGVYFVVATPRVKGVPNRKTLFMREILPSSIGLNLYTVERSKLMALILGLLNRDREALRVGFGSSFIDEIRGRYIPCYHELKERLAEIGHPLAISGAGPTTLTYCFDEVECVKLAAVFKRVYEDECGVEANVKMARPVESPLVRG